MSSLLCVQGQRPLIRDQAPVSQPRASRGQTRAARAEAGTAAGRDLLPWGPGTRVSERLLESKHFENSRPLRLQVTVSRGSQHEETARAGFRLSGAACRNDRSRVFALVSTTLPRGRVGAEMHHESPFLLWSPCPLSPPLPTYLRSSDSLEFPVAADWDTQAPLA